VAWRALAKEILKEEDEILTIKNRRGCFQYKAVVIRPEIRFILLFYF